MTEKDQPQDGSEFVEPFKGAAGYPYESEGDYGLPTEQQYSEVRRAWRAEGHHHLLLSITSTSFGAALKMARIRLNEGQLGSDAYRFVRTHAQSTLNSARAFIGFDKSDGPKG